MLRRSAPHAGGYTTFLNVVFTLDGDQSRKCPLLLLKSDIPRVRNLERTLGELRRSIGRMRLKVCQHLGANPSQHLLRCIASLEKHVRSTFELLGRRHRKVECIRIPRDDAKQSPDRDCVSQSLGAYARAERGLCMLCRQILGALRHDLEERQC